MAAHCPLPGGLKVTEEEGKRLVTVGFPKLSYPHLNVVVSVVVEVEHPVELGVESNPQVVGVLDPFAQRLPCVLLHLDVVELPGKEVICEYMYEVH